MNATRTIFDSYARPHSLDFSSDLQALPSIGLIWNRIKTVFSNWTQAAMQAEAESRLWDSAQADPRIMAELVQSRVRSETAAVEPLKSFAMERLAHSTDNQPLNDGWGSILAHAYQTRFHSNGAQIA